MCIAGARSVNKIKTIWTMELTNITKYRWDDIKDDIDSILFCINNETKEQLNAELEANSIYF